MFNAFIGDKFDEPFDYHSEELAALKKRGVQKMSAFERFKKAGMESVYATVYNSLSADSHNNIRSLLERHLRVKGNTTEVIIFRKIEESDIAPLLYSLTDMYLRSGLMVHQHFHSNGADVFRHYLDQMLRDATVSE